MNNFKELKSFVKGIFLENELMSKHTSYGIGGPASAYIVPKDRFDLSNILKFAKKYSVPTYFIGSGSNLLVSDDGIDGLVLSPAKSLKQLEINSPYVDAEAGVMLGKLVKETIKNNLTGLESLVGVPGTLGGALIMNAGAFGGEISSYLIKVDLMNMDGNIYKYDADDINFSYRNSTFKSNEFILSAKFILNKDDPNAIKEKRDFASKGRKSNQPLRYRSAGSVFKNTPTHAAGYLIDQAGLKGTRIGDAEISTHHANFFINKGSATASDVIALIELTKSTVLKKFDVELELEIKTIGFKNNNYLINE